MALGIGSRVWRFDTNRRVYASGKSGPIWREHWQPMFVVGEASRSWIVGPSERMGPDHRATMKAPKKRDHIARRVWAYSEAELDASCWENENRYKLMRAVEHCQPEVLVDVARLVAPEIAETYPKGGA